MSVSWCHRLRARARGAGGAPRPGQGHLGSSGQESDGMGLLGSGGRRTVPVLGVPDSTCIHRDRDLQPAGEELCCK